MSSNQGILGRSRGSDTIYVLDRSKSTGDKFGETNYSKLQIACSTLYTTLSDGRFLPNDKIGIISVNETILLSKPIVTEILPLVNSNGLPREQIMSLKSEGGTAERTGIEAAVKMLVENKTSNELNLVVITDMDWYTRNNVDINTDLVITEARRSHTKIHFILLGDTKDKRDLQMISDLTSGRLFYVNNKYDLQRVMRIFNQTPTEEGLSPEQSTEVRPKLISENAGAAEENRRVKTLDELQEAVRDLTEECSTIEAQLKKDPMFDEKYSITLHHLYELRQLLASVFSRNHFASVRRPP